MPGLDYLCMHRYNNYVMGHLSYNVQNTRDNRYAIVNWMEPYENPRDPLLYGHGRIIKIYNTSGEALRERTELATIIFYDSDKFKTIKNKIDNLECIIKPYGIVNTIGTYTEIELFA